MYNVEKMLSDKVETQTTTEAATAVSHSELLYEISRHKSESLLKLSEKPLQWWRIHRYSFPHLAELAQKYLAIVATSTTSERLFSTAGNIINSKRAALSTEYVNELVFLHENSPAIHNLPYKKLHCECEQCIEK